ncbi:GFA family protein [Roseovarius arcticus]|uniref:GFA family protein n=1 Tax=Roseovarius arcticus TaxID=2547404 RepID=UPI0011100D17|nr:GFA family protein [Roseovarius arcticus]
MPHTGSCMCGAAKFSFDAPVTEAAACHCSTCRKWSGGILMAVEVPAEDLKIQAGDTVKVYPSSEWGERSFCSDCGSSLWFRLIAPGPKHGTYYLSMGTLDDTSGITMTHEIFSDQRPEGYAMAGDHTRMTSDEFFAMMQEEMS